MCSLFRVVCPVCGCVYKAFWMMICTKKKSRRRGSSSNNSRRKKNEETTVITRLQHPHTHTHKYENGIDQQKCYTKSVWIWNWCKREIEKMKRPKEERRWRKSSRRKGKKNSVYSKWQLHTSHVRTSSTSKWKRVKGKFKKKHIRKELASNEMETARPFNEIAEKKIPYTHTQSPIEHVDRLYFNSISMCRLYHIGSWAKMTFVLYTIYIPSIEAQRMNLKAIAKNARTRTDARAPYTQLHMTRIRLFSADFDERRKNSTTKPMHISS